MTDAAAKDEGRARPAGAVPATLVTGFLGSGKTTLLNRLLKRPEMAASVVIVNEFGEIGIDHVLIETALEDAVLLKSGCICCTVRGDLVDTLASLAARRDAGTIPPFRRALIESTGLADPAPILQDLMAARALEGRFRLERVIATVDAANAERQLATQYESAKQVALADALVLTKTDLIPPAAAARVEALLAALNPRAPIHAAVMGAIEPRYLFAPDDAADRAERIARVAAAFPAHDHGAGRGEDGAAHAAHHGIETFALTRAAPVDWTALADWLGAIASLRGADLLRVKGIVNVSGRAGPVAIDAVQHLFHPPRELARWPDADRRTRIVFITRNIPRRSLEESFFAALGAEA